MLGKLFPQQSKNLLILTEYSPALNTGVFKAGVADNEACCKMSHVASHKGRGRWGGVFDIDLGKKVLINQCERVQADFHTLTLD